MSEFTLIILVGISFNWQVLCTFMPLIIFLTSISLVCVKEETDLKFFSLMFLMLTYYLNYLRKESI